MIHKLLLNHAGNSFHGFKYEVDLNVSVKDNLKPFKEEVLDELYSIHLKHGDLTLLFSGGMDSTFILRSLKELGINPKIITFSFSPNNDDFESELVKSKCKEYGAQPPDFFYIDKNDFFNHCNSIIESNQLPYPMIHGYMMDYFLNVHRGMKFYTGMSCEYKLKDNKIFIPAGPFLVKDNNPDQLYGFTTDKTFLSYFKHKQFVNNYKKENVYLNNGQLDRWYVRDLIYMDCYPDITRVSKDIPYDHRRYIDSCFDSHVYLSKPIPPCTFDADYLVNL